MKTFVNLCKKPLLIVSAVLTLAFLVLLIVSYTTPLGKNYVYSKTQDGVEGKIEITLGDKYLMKYYLDGKEMDMSELYGDDGEGVDYVIKDGVIYVTFTEETYKELSDTVKEYLAKTMPKIEGYKIVGTMGTDEMVAVCTANTAMQIVSIVLLVVSALALAGCVTVLVLDKKGIIKTEK